MPVTDKKPAPAQPLVDESTLTVDQLKDKLEESRAEAKRLNGILSKNKETIDGLGRQYNEKTDQNQRLVDEINNLRTKLSQPFESTPGTDNELPSMKEIYLSIVRGLAPELSCNIRNITQDQLKTRIHETATHVIGVAQILHKATTEKFLYRK